MSLLVAFCIGELGLRILGHRGVAMLDISERIRPVDDDIIDYRYKPDTEHWTGDVIYRFNHAGFRDEDHLLAKPEGSTRVAVIGDSVTVGTGVRAEDIFAAQARHLLGKDIELINIAMSGLNAPQVVHLLEVEGLRYQPDIVVMNFVLNDCDFYTRYQATLRTLGARDGEIGLLGIPIDARLKRLLKSSALIYFVSQQAERLFGEEEIEHADYVIRIWGSESKRARVTDAFDQLAALRDSNGFDVVVMIWPVIVPFDDYPYAEIHDWVAAEARTRGMEVIDLLPAYAANAEHSDYYVSPNDYFHPNARGHAVSAAAFRDWMSAHSR
jgi:lysophospholipase L1-like esterase